MFLNLIVTHDSLIFMAINYYKIFFDTLSRAKQLFLCDFLTLVMHFNDLDCI